MPHAASGVVARGVLRRKFPENLPVPAHTLGEYMEIYPYRTGMGKVSYSRGSRFSKWCFFTQQISCIEVERGHLGEVVSLVGDCRPPPPGNPRRPTSQSTKYEGRDEWKMSLAKVSEGSRIFSTIFSKRGGIIFTLSKLCSFKKQRITNNLKELNKPQYFKSNRSYTPCVEKEHVLEFSHVHSHLCGLKVVEPPSIAITNVLEI